MTPSAGGVWRPLWRDVGNREANTGSTIGELALLQRQHSLLQEELLRLRDAESRFKDSEKARVKLERQVRHMKVCSGAPFPSQQLGDQAFQVRIQRTFLKKKVKSNKDNMVFSPYYHKLRSINTEAFPKCMPAW